MYDKINMETICSPFKGWGWVAVLRSSLDKKYKMDELVLQFDLF